jgi:hypothetical protein
MAERGDEALMPTIESRTIEIAGEIKRYTEKAIQLYDGKTTCWIPRRLVTENGEPLEPDRIGDGIFEMPEWKALEKGLI